MGNYMQEAANVSALVFATIFLVECVRGLVSSPRDPVRRTFAYLTVAVLAVNVVGNIHVYAAIDRRRLRRDRSAQQGDPGGRHSFRGGRVVA